MSARQKLNHAFFNGVLILSLVIGAASESLLAGFISFGVGLVLALKNGDIRIQPRNQK